MSKIVGGSLKYDDCRDGKDAELLRILKKKVIDEVFVPGTSANPASAALPVSPDVAVSMTISFDISFFFAAVVIR